MAEPASQSAPAVDAAKLAWVRKTGSLSSAGAPGSRSSAAQAAPAGAAGQSSGSPAFAGPNKNDAESKQSAARNVFTAEWESVKAELLKVLELKPDDPELRKIHTQMTAVDARMKDKLRKGDFIAATKDLDELIALFDKFSNYASAQSTAKAAFAAKWDGVKDEILKDLESKPDDPKLKDIHKQMTAVDERMKALLRKDDFAGAGKELDRLIAFMADFRKADAERSAQVAARAAFSSRWAAVKDGLLKVLGTKPDEPELQDIYNQMTAIDAQMKALLHKDDFAAAGRELERLVALLDDFRKAEKNSPRGGYEAALVKIRFALDEALSRDWKSKEMTDLQDGLVKKKKEMEAAAAKKDYAQAMKLLEELTALVNDFLGETRKTSRGCDWVRDTAALLHATIHRKYLEAASKLDAATQAYDDALKDFHETLDSEHNFAADFLIEVFFIGLGGVAGGAVGAKVKGLFDKAVQDTKAVGAMIDATKDITKFLTRSAQKLGGSADDPLKGLTALEGNGVDLGRKVGKRLKDEAAKLLLGVEGLLKLVRDSDCKVAEFRIEGDPVKTLDNDPFLSILGDLSPEKTAFGRLIWKEWVDQLPATKILTNSFEKKIHDQTGGDAGVQQALDVRKKAHGKMVEENWQKSGRGA